MTATPIERLRAMVDSERLRSIATDLLDELDPEAVRMVGETLTELADAMDAATDAVETWAEAEDREEKADARDAALEAIQQVCDGIEGLGGAAPDWVAPALSEAS